MPTRTISRYGANWPEDYDPLQIEFGCIRKGGKWGKNGECGLGLFHHYKEAQKLMFPSEDHHRWSDLLLQEFLNNTITAVLGPKDSGKTRGASKFALTDYFVFPDDTLILISSTDLRGLEMRVWGDLKSLFERARERFDWLPGNPIDSKHAICTDDISEDGVRDMRKGIICIPCLSSSGQFVGLGKYVGIKQKRRRLIGDETQFMREGFLEAIANLNSGDFKGIFLGNPIGQDDPLDKVSEPKDGWSSIPEPEKTATWENRWIGGRTVNLVGTDSPNFDYPQDKPPQFPYLVNQRSIDAVVAFYRQDSLQFYSQCKGVRRTGLNAHRVITRELCEQFKAFDHAVWEGSPRIKIGGLDAAYGGAGGDRCVGGHIEFGEELNGKTVIEIHPPQIVPVSVRKAERPEDQIAVWSKQYCETHGIDPENWFFDATGRGSLGTSYARLWSAAVQPVEFGGRPTDRPVSLDLLIIDRETGERRLKLCSEHYSKFVTELWFAIAYAIQSEQIRGLPDEVAKEGYMREWKEVRGDKIEIETKADTKQRMGRSPDLFDWLVTCVEGARRRGFSISKLAQPREKVADNYFETEEREYQDLLKSKLLVHHT